jgi:Ca2+-dependent lipid-binding protein
MALSRDQSDRYSIVESINDKSFNSDEEPTYDDNVERTHRNSADSCSSERTLVFSYLDFQDAIKSSIYDKPEVHTCDCAAESELKNDKIDKVISEYQYEISQNSQNEPRKEQPQPQPSPPQNSLYAKNEAVVIFILVSIISYAIGHFGFTYVWLSIILYQSIMWYNNVAKDHEERVRWEVTREMSMEVT